MIIVVDFGSQFTQLVARRIRECGVYSEIIPHSNAYEIINKFNDQKKLTGIIFSGGPFSVYEQGAPTISKQIFDLNVPILGICYGFQLINHLLGGRVVPSPTREYGFEEINIEQTIPNDHPLKTLCKKENTVWMSHGDKVELMAQDLVPDSITRAGITASFHHKHKQIFGVQFHPEVEHTPCGRELLKNFALNTCHSQKNWDAQHQVNSIVKKIEDQVNAIDPTAQVICALSGGVDSCVAAVLASKALGHRLHCIFVNNGLLRQDEYESTLESFKEHLNLNVVGVNASELFLSQLEGVFDPEEKRKIIGKTFIDVFDEQAKKIKNAVFLVQGTLYPDVIESVPVHGVSVTIKSHHNVGGLPKKMNLKLIEPLRDLFKDEVRNIGKELGIDPSFLKRHPFPGPGLAIRCIGTITKERLSVLRQADRILIEELKNKDLYDSVWQAFVALLPVQTVGVMGDGRTYESVAAIRCVSAIDGMTADWSRLPHEFLARVSGRIINEVKGINRVVYDISSKPPATIEWE